MNTAPKLTANQSVTLTVSVDDVALIVEALGYTACYMPDAPEQRLEAIRQTLRALATAPVQP